MARIEVNVSGIPVDEAQIAQLEALLTNTVEAMAGTGYRPPITVLLGHNPMVIAEGLTEQQQQELAAAVVTAVLSITQSPIDPTERGQVDIVFAPASEREVLLQQAVDLIRLRDERIYAMQRASGDPDASASLQQELEQIERDIDALREQLSSID